MERNIGGNANDDDSSRMKANASSCMGQKSKNLAILCVVANHVKYIYNLFTNSAL